MSINLNAERDPHLWSLAKKRVGFKEHFWSYLVVISFLWLLWYLILPAPARGAWIPWPIWPTFGWGIGLTFHFVFTYIIPNDKHALREREYEKLIKEKK